VPRAQLDNQPVQRVAHSCAGYSVQRTQHHRVHRPMRRSRSITIAGIVMREARGRRRRLATRRRLHTAVRRGRAKYGYVPIKNHISDYDQCARLRRTKLLRSASADGKHVGYGQRWVPPISDAPTSDTLKPRRPGGSPLGMLYVVVVVVNRTWWITSQPWPTEASSSRHERACRTGLRFRGQRSGKAL
jgi:hypothetical protein